MTDEPKCPPPDRLQSLLDDALCGDELAALHEHLENCDPCRRQLVELASGNETTSGLASRLMEHGKRPAPEAALARVMSESKAQMIFPTTHGESGLPAEVALDFLSPPDHPDQLGRLGPYGITEVIGRGGMGMVLKGHDPRLNRFVAVKVLTPQLAASATARARFRREGQAAAAVTHDHVIAIHAVDEANGLPYLVMEYVAGRSLEQRIEQTGPLELKEILRIGMQMAGGLAAAHAQGLVHRDIKPANILLENGVERVKITDFGLARAVDDVRITRPGVLTGTPEYMSPEQARGESVDHRSDLFSLGCVLYAMCTGRPPFRAENTVAQVRRVCDDTPRPIAQINPDIPDWLAEIIDKLLAKQPDDRFQSAAEVGELLAAHLAHLQQPAVHPQPANVVRSLRERTVGQAFLPARAYHRASRRWLIAAAAVLLLCAGLTLAESTGVTHVAASVIRIVRGDGTLVVEVDDPNIQVLIDGEELVITGAGPKEVRLRPGQHELQSVKDGKPVQTQHITITRDGRQIVKVAREQTAPEVGPKDSAPQVRQSESAPTAPTTRRVWAKAVNRLYWGTASPDGKYVAFIDWASGDVAVRDVATSETRRLSNEGFPENGGYPIFSPDGQQVAYLWTNKEQVKELRTIGIDGSHRRVLFANKDKEITNLEPREWSADGKSILAIFVGKTGNQLVLVSALDGSVRVVKESNSFRLNGFYPPFNERTCLSPDGRYVAYSAEPRKNSYQRDIFLLATDGSGEVPLIEHPADDFVLGWAPDGKRLVFGSDRTWSVGIWVIEVAEGKPQGAAELVKPAMGQFQALGLTRGGSLFYGVYSGGMDVYTATLDFEQGQLLTPPALAMQRSEGSNLNPAWSPDGRYLACMSSRQWPAPVVHIRSLETNEVRELAPNFRSFALAVLDWSGDGRALVGPGTNEEGEKGVLRLDVQTGAVTRIPTNESCLFAALAQDGKSLFYFSQYSGRPEKPGRFLRRDLETGVEHELYQISEYVTFVALSPDGQKLAFIEGVTGALKLLPIAGGQPQELTKSAGMTFETILTGEGFILSVAWTPDGRHLVYQKFFPPTLSMLAKRILRSGPLDPADVKTELWRVPVAGGPPQKLDVALPTMAHLRIHPDGRQIAFSGQSAQSGKNEIWVLENFLPPLKDSQSAAAADASAAKDKSATNR